MKLLYQIVIMCCIYTAPASLWSLDLTPYAGEDAPLLADKKELRLQQWRHLIVDQYLQIGKQAPQHQDNIMTVLEHVARRKAGLSTEAQ